MKIFVVRIVVRHLAFCGVDIGLNDDYCTLSLDGTGGPVVLQHLAQHNTTQHNNTRRPQYRIKSPRVMNIYIVVIVTRPASYRGWNGVLRT